MASAKAKMIKQVAGLYLARDATGTFGSSTLAAAAAAGASTLSVTASTNFANGDPIRIGSGEETELNKISGAITGAGPYSFPLETPLVYAHASGDVVVEQIVYDIGDPTADGVTISYAGESTDIFVATKRLTYATLTGFVDATGGFSFPGVSIYNIALATGALLAKVVGSGTQAAPYQYASDGTEFSGDTNMSLIVVGTLMDGTTMQAQLFAVDFDYTGITFALTRGQNAAVPVRVTGAGGIFSTTAPSFTPVTTYKPGKGKVFDALTEAGFFIDATATPGNSTVSSGGGAGTNSVVVASGTNFAIGDWVRFGSGDTVEIWQLENVVTNTLTIRGLFYRSQAASTVVKELQQIAISGLTPEGATVSFGGNIDLLRNALKRVSIGTRPGNANVTLSMQLEEISLSNFAYALGIPQSAIASNRLPAIASNLTTDTALHGVYLKGTLLDATNLFVMGWGPTLDISQVQTVFNNAGQPGAIPFTAKPTSGICFLNW